MKNRLTFLKNTILLLGGGLLVLALVSCENFLRGAEVQKEIEEAIAIANSNSVTYNIVTDKGSGTVNLTQITGKKKDSFELIFTTEENWQFVCWEVINKDTGTVVQDVMKFTPSDKPETKCTITNPKENVLIHAKCVQIPTIVSVEPEGTGYANTPIKVKFNMPVEAEDVSLEQTLFKSSNISIKCNGTTLTYSDYYETPVFNDDKTELTFNPKSDLENGLLLKKYMTDNNIGVASVEVVFSSDIVVATGDSFLPIKNPSFTVNFLSTIETAPPEKKALVVSRDASLSIANAESFAADKIFHDKNVAKKSKDITDDQYEQLVLQNACNGTVYIYGRYVDEGSGVKSVVVTEKRTNDIDRNVTNDLHTTEYTSSNAEFITIDKEVRFLITHVLSVETGAVTLTVDVCDVCMNANSSVYSIVKNSEGVWPYFNNGKDSSYYYSNMSNTWINLDTYKTALCTYLCDYSNLTIENQLWDTADGMELYYPIDFPIDKVNIVIEYKDISNQLTTSAYENWEYIGCDYYGNVTLVDLGMKPDSSIKLITQDFLGNRKEKVLWTFPSAQTKLFLEITKHEDAENPANSYADVVFHNEDGSVANPVLIRTNSQGQKECSLLKKINPGYTYNVMINGVILDNCSFSYDTPVAQSVSKVLIKNVDVTKSKENSYLTATVKIDDDSWNNYDMIYLEYMKNYYDSKNVFFQRGITEVSFDFLNTYIYEDNSEYRKIYIYGIKDNKISAENYYEMQKQSIQDKDYDNCAPGYGNYKMNGENYFIDFYDDGTGLNNCSAQVINEAYNINKTYELGNDGTFTIPYLLLFPSSSKPSRLYVNASDIAGNHFVDEGINILPQLTRQPKIELFKKLDDGSIILNNQTDGDCFIGYSYVDDNGGFEHELSSNETVEGEHQDNGEYVGKTKISKSELDCISTSYIKIVFIDGYYGFTNPIYYYNGAGACSNENDYLIPNGRLGNSFVVGSGAPVFVQTVVTAVPFEECSTWDYKEWEYFKEEYGQKILNISPSATSKVYYVPTDEIPSGYSYVVIAHYSDNHVVMSDVMVR